MADLFQETIIWAQQHGIPTPGFTADGQTTVEATAREIIAAEQALVQQFGKLLEVRAAGLLKRSDLDRFDRASDQLFQAKLQFYRDITSGRVWQALNAVGAASDIPYPQRLPLASALLGVQPNTLRGLGDGGAISAPLAGVGWGTIVIAVVLVVGALAITLVALASAFEARVNSQQHIDELTNRMRVYNECVGAGGSRDDCALTASLIVPPVPPPPGADDPMWVHRLKKAAIYGGVAMGAIAVGYLAVKYASKRIEERPALRGLPSGSFAGARYPVKSRTRRSARKSLRGRDYNMEVE